MNSDEFGWSEFGELQNLIWRAVYRWRMESGLMGAFLITNFGDSQIFTMYPSDVFKLMHGWHHSPASADQVLEETMMHHTSCSKSLTVSDPFCSGTLRKKWLAILRKFYVVFVPEQHFCGVSLCPLLSCQPRHHYESFWGFTKMSHFYAQHKNIQNLNPNPLRPV
jgi:hypothetical protein